MSLIFLMIIVAVAVFLVPLWKIFSKAGFNPLLSLISFIPGFGWLICMAILAFADWPEGQEEA